MNVKDFQSELPEGKDLLQLIFDKQFELMKKYHDIESNNLGFEFPAVKTMGIGLDINSTRVQYRIKDMMWRVTEELGEAANTLKNKPWKNTHMLTDEVHYLEEIIDAVHFFVELLIMSGFTPESLAIMYLNKNAVNHFRQRSNY
jgi:hypothetical protein